MLPLLALPLRAAGCLTGQTARYTSNVVDYLYPEGAEAQARWGEISGVGRTHYCGAYWGYGFHEDGVRSGLRVAERFGRSP